MKNSKKYIHKKRMHIIKRKKNKDIGGYANKAESHFVRCARNVEWQIKHYDNSFTDSISHSKRGYPDFTIYKNGKIFGFVEVKPNKGDDLKTAQRLFGQFCVDHSIPFMRWCPEDGIEALKRFICVK